MSGCYVVLSQFDLGELFYSQITLKNGVPAFCISQNMRFHLQTTWNTEHFVEEEDRE